jgi:hypothetical protein
MDFPGSMTWFFHYIMELCMHNLQNGQTRTCAKLKSQMLSLLYALIQNRG